MSYREVGTLLREGRRRRMKEKTRERSVGAFHETFERGPIKRYPFRQPSGATAAYQN